MKAIEELIGVPYRLGGRSPKTGLDCLGIVLLVARSLGLPAPDPWRKLRADYRAGTIDASTGFPKGWELQEEKRPSEDGDIVIFDVRGELAVGIFVDGFIVSSCPQNAYSYRIPAYRVREPREVWRFVP